MFILASDLFKKKVINTYLRLEIRVEKQIFSL